MSECEAEMCPMWDGQGCPCETFGEACIDDLCPVHHGIALGIEFVTKKIAALGNDPELFNSIPNPSKTGGGDE